MSKDTMNDVNMPQPLDNDDRYLWDKSGPVDREIEQLEQKLQVLRYEGQAPQMRIGARRWRTAPFAIAAGLTPAASVPWMVFQ